jgi:hypothetical protein
MALNLFLFQKHKENHEESSMKAARTSDVTGKQSDASDI